MDASIVCDGHEVARLQNGAFFDLQLPAGRHGCQIRDGGNLEVRGHDFEAGEDFYFRVYWSHHFTLEEAPPTQAKQDIGKLRPLDKEWIVAPTPAK